MHDQSTAPSTDTKTCSVCGAIKPITDFNRLRRSADGRNGRCRKCVSASNKRWRMTPPGRAHISKQNARYGRDAGWRERQLAYVNQRRQRIADWISEIKIAAGGCLYCGEADPACLDFHHVDPTTKVKNIAQLQWRRIDWDAVRAEVVKCVVVCANCHRKLHRRA